MGFVSAARADVNPPVAIPPPLGIAAAGAPLPQAPSPAILQAASVALPESPASPPALSEAETPVEIMRFVTLGRVTFVSNKWQLSAAAKQALDTVSAYLAANPGASRVLLDGHTDWVGGIKFNDTLSDKRAMAVQAYLLGKGLDPDLIHWKGYGKRAPIDENWTRLGRDRNRQVEIYAVYPPPR